MTLSNKEHLKIFLCGDVMTGRGIDQVLPHPVNPKLHEPYCRNAYEYVTLAQNSSGVFPFPVQSSYIWGDALRLWQEQSPDLKIINLETSITTSEDFSIRKSVHYRMNPQNIDALTVAGIDCCCLANNHVMDWGETGLLETLETLRKVNIKTAGAGRNIMEAKAPATFEMPGNSKVVIVSYGDVSSGVPFDWMATQKKPGINLLENVSEKTILNEQTVLKRVARSEDFLILSIHWGDNWGYEIPSAQIEFAHRMIDEAGADLIYGHSSHHVKGIEVHKNKLILYGSGDFVNDYEGIVGFEEYRGDLSLMYFVTVALSSGYLVELEMVPTTMKQFSVGRATATDSRYLCEILNREGLRFGTSARMSEKSSSLFLDWRH